MKNTALIFNNNCMDGAPEQHSVEIISFKLQGNTIRCILFYYDTCLAQIQAAACWNPWELGKHRFPPGMQTLSQCCITCMGCYTERTPAVRLLSFAIISSSSKCFHYTQSGIHRARTLRTLMSWCCHILSLSLPDPTLNNRWCPRVPVLPEVADGRWLVSMSVEGQYILMQMQWAGTTVFLQEP